MERPVSDEALWIRQAQHGDDRAFGHLVERYQKPVYNLCYRMLGEADAADDAAQETFLRAYQHLQRFDSQRSFSTWLLSIAAHYCIDCLRRQRLPMFSIDESPEEDSFPRELADPHDLNPEQEAERRQEQELLRRLIQALDPTDRAAIVLRYWHEASEAEIAEMLGLTVSAVKSRLHRARLTLARRWQELTPSPALGERIAYES